MWRGKLDRSEAKIRDTFKPEASACCTAAFNSASRPLTYLRTVTIELDRVAAARHAFRCVNLLPGYSAIVALSGHQRRGLTVSHSLTVNDHRYQPGSQRSRRGQAMKRPIYESLSAPISLLLSSNAPHPATSIISLLRHASNARFSNCAVI